MTHIYSYWGYGSAFSFLNPPIRTIPLIIDKLNVWRSVSDKITNLAISHYDASDAEIAASFSSDNSPGSKYFPKPGGGDCVWSEVGCPGDGNWHSYQYYLKANSVVGVSDGEYKFWYDGQLILNKTGIRWATANASTSPRHLWNAFTFGANNYNKFAPQPSELEQWYAIDDVVVSTNYIPDDYVIP